VLSGLTSEGIARELQVLSIETARMCNGEGEHDVTLAAPGRD